MAGDANLILLASTALTATGDATGLLLRKPSSSGTNQGGTVRRGMKARVTVTLVSGTNPTMAYKLQHSDDNSTWTDLATCLTASVTAAGEYFIPFETSKAYVRLSYTIGGTSTPTFTTQADITMGRP
jgi:hypothetical protein